MPEKGWGKVSIRVVTTEEIKSKARAQHLTIDEYLNKVMRRAEGTYERCSICEQSVPKEDMGFHFDAHVKANPDAFFIRKYGKCVCGGQRFMIRLKEQPDAKEVLVHQHALKQGKRV